jgi:hypothetical protein
VSKELKAYELRATRRPAKSDSLLTTVLVMNAQGEQGYCYVNFSLKLVQAVGKKLPRGISPQDPAFLHVFHSGEEYSVWAVYAREGWNPSSTKLMWTGEGNPSWLNFYKVKAERNGNTDPPPPAGPGSGSTPARGSSPGTRRARKGSTGSPRSAAEATEALGPVAPDHPDPGSGAGLRQVRRRRKA